METKMLRLLCTVVTVFLVMHGYDREKYHEIFFSTINAFHLIF